jgi:hypothetical protein
MKTPNDVGPSTSADPVPDHRPGVDDFVEPLLVDVAGLERGLLQSQASVIRLVRDGGSLVIPDHRAERGHSTSWLNRSKSSSVAMPTCGKKVSI